MSGRSGERPEAASSALPLEAILAAVPCRGGEELIRRMFEPLGYAVSVTQHPLDPSFPEWGPSHYFTVSLSANVRLADILTHIYVLVPVLDRDKHYWVGPDEVDKLISRGEGWLDTHPERDAIVQRYLKFRPDLTRDALARLSEDTDPDADAAERDAEESTVEKTIRLREERIEVVLSLLKRAGARRVIDLGCGEGRLLAELSADPSFTFIAGVDVSARALDRAAGRLHLDRMPAEARDRFQLFQGSLLYRDDRIAGFDAATCLEVVEHLDPGRLETFARVVFGEARPSTVVITTPNREYNSRFAGLPAGHHRHRDHRFEWTREEFRAWAHTLEDRFGYRAEFVSVGAEDPEVGPPTQMAVLTR